VRTLWGGTNRDVFSTRTSDKNLGSAHLDGFVGKFEFGTCGNAIAGNIRLSNWQSLTAVLVGNSFKANLRDTDLLLLGYEKWGEELPLYLDGEFSFSIWDARRKRLFCCRDQVGSRNFYYYHADGRFRFGDSLHALFSNTDIPRHLNRKKLAALAIPSGHTYFDEETFFDGVFSLRPGSFLILDESGLRKQAYWRPQVKPELIPRDDTEAFAKLIDLMQTAVVNRMRGSSSIAVFLSGGLDSSAVVSLAAGALQKENRSLLGISHVVPDQWRSRFQDEREFIEEYHYPNLSIEYVSAEGRGPFDCIDRPEMLRDTFSCGSASFIMEDMESTAFNCGADLGLGGQGGEFSVTCSGIGCLTELALTVRFGVLWKLLRDMRRTTGVSPLRLAAADLLTSFMPRRGKRPMVYLTPAFQRECLARPTVQRSWVDQRYTHLHAVEAFLRAHARPGAVRNGGKLRLSEPLFDKQLLEYCIAAPISMKIREGYSRYMVRRAMDGLVPAKIQWRKQKRVASVDYSARYEAQLPKVLQFLRSIAPRDPVRSVVEVDRLLTTAPVSTGSEQGWEIPNTVYLICFLRQFAEFRV
jgi:asparagine synthase (glutamine-hydrolysing)